MRQSSDPALLRTCGSHVVIDWYKCNGRAAGTHLQVVKTSRCKLLTCHRLSSASASVCIFVQKILFVQLFLWCSSSSSSFSSFIRVPIPSPEPLHRPVGLFGRDAISFRSFPASLWRGDMRQPNQS